jgi:CheY-like chemotaxis protein
VKQLLHILIVDDNPADVKWMRVVLIDTGLRFIDYVAVDGQEALDFLLRRGPHAEAFAPDIVFLDINLPRINGIEVLHALRDNTDVYPICLLTGSWLERDDVLKIFALDPRRYIVKPADRQRVIDAMAAFDHLKPVVAQLPIALP